MGRGEVLVVGGEEHLLVRAFDLRPASASDA
jgi:hypothetical protein